MLSFLIVGTPGSGIDTVRALAELLPGVGAAPATHVLGVMQSRGITSPVPSADVPGLLREVADLVGPERLDVDEVRARVPAGRVFAVELLDAVAATLRPWAAVLGEATPTHLHWWLPLSRALPGLRVVGVVRDPRAVCAAAARLHPRGLDLAAEAWVLDQRQMRAMADGLGPERSLLLAHDDLVGDPRWAVRQMSRLLRVDDPTGDLAPSRWPAAPGDEADEDAPPPLSRTDRRWVEARCGAEARRWGFRGRTAPATCWSDTARMRHARAARARMLADREVAALTAL